jgi:hypothetical protein
MTRRKTRVVIVSTIVLALLAGTTVLWFVSIDFQAWVRHTFTSDLPFNSDDWKQGDPILQGRMMWDLCNREKVVLLDRDEVLAKLGPPTRAYQEGKLWIYDLDYRESAWRRARGRLTLEFGGDPNPQYRDQVIGITY